MNKPKNKKIAKNHVFKSKKTRKILGRFKSTLMLDIKNALLENENSNNSTISLKRSECIKMSETIKFIYDNEDRDINRFEKISN